MESLSLTLAQFGTLVMSLMSQQSMVCSQFPNEFNFWYVIDSLTTQIWATQQRIQHLDFDQNIKLITKEQFQIEKGKIGKNECLLCCESQIQYFYGISMTHILLFILFFPPLNQINNIIALISRPLSSNPHFASFNPINFISFPIKKDSMKITISFSEMIINMRNYSRENLRTCTKEVGIARTLTGEKPMGAALKQTEVRIGKYKYDQKDQLGKGFSSNVFKGVQILKPHKRYAIKVISLKKFRGSSLQMLESEIEIHKSLNHQQVVKLHQVIKTSHHFYLVLQYCPHGNLSQYIAQKKQLSQSNALQIITQMLSAYKYVLSEGIVHRDIKPANILRVGNKWKLSDFGFATRSRFGFKDRMNVGTPLYMAPESLKKNYYSFKSDLYSLGIVLFEMVVGRTPHEVETQKQLIDRLSSDIILPKHLKNIKIIQFLSKVCQISDAKRMSKEQFESFDFGMSFVQSNSVSGTQSCSSLSQTDRKFSGTTDDSLSKQPHQSFTKPVDSYLKQMNDTSNTNSKHVTFFSEQHKFNKNPMIANKELLSLQLQYVRHFYYTVQNIDSFHLEDNTRSMFILALFKMLLKIMRLLCDKTQNHFQLTNWEQYQHCKLHQQLYSNFTACSEKYQKEYLQFIKHNDIKVIRAVNRKFPQLCHNAPLSSKFYQNFKTFIASIIREHVNELNNLVNSNQDQLNDRYQALESAYTIYKLAQVRSNGPNLMPQTQKLAIVPDYTESKRTKCDFMNLKRLIAKI